MSVLGFDHEPSATLLCPECLYTFNAHRKICSPVTLRRIRANYLPNESEVYLFKEWVEDTKRDFARYDAEIGRLRSILKKLEGERAYLQRYADEYRTLLSPIRRLPPEVLTNIATLYCQDQPSVLKKTGVTPPLTIAQTCAVWRALAFNTPSLWSSFHVELGPMSLGSLQLLSTYLKLSGDHPLSVTLVCGRGSNWDDVFLQTLLEHTRRWKHLILHHADLIQNLPSPPDLPILESLELSSQLLRASPIFKSMPWLRTLILDDVEFEDLEEGYFPFTQLTSVTLRRLQMGSALRVLNRCPSLREAVISCRRNFSWSPTVEYNPPIDLRRLTSLTVINELISDFFQNITTPALSSLTIATPAPPHNNMDAWPQEVFVAFLRRSLCPLKRLSLLRVELSDTDLLAILDFTPCLTHLSVMESRADDLPATITNQFLRQLTFPKVFHPSRRPPLPRLELVDFVVHQSEIDYGLVVDLLESRSSEVAKREGYSIVRDVSVRQGNLDKLEFPFIRQDVIPKVEVPLAPIIDRITNRVFALGGSVVTPMFSFVRLLVPGLF
ncbi:hypothetical protein WG66_010312 [Moniliophthora roreri]|nr:hypothetical protein WG66_010312 [Moniliophthora roreri]